MSSPRAATESARRTSRLALVSLVLGLMSAAALLLYYPAVARIFKEPGWIFLAAALPLLLGFTAIVLGLVSFLVIGRSQGRLSGHVVVLLGMAPALLAVALGGWWSLRIARAVGKTHEAALRIKSEHNLREIGVALIEHDQEKGRLPPASQNGLSWRVWILPYLEQDDLFRQFKLDEPWDGPHNRTLVGRMPPAYASPLHAETPAGHTHYRALVGAGSVFGNQPPLSLAQVGGADGQFQTMVVVEAAEAVPWTKPDELPCDAGQPLPGFGAADRPYFLALFADATVRPISRTADPGHIRAWITWNGSENVPSPE